MSFIAVVFIVVLFIVSPAVEVTYILADMLKNVSPRARAVYQALLPVAWISCLLFALSRVIVMVVPDHNITLWDYVIVAVHLWIGHDAYNNWKRDGDGRWKKKLKSLSARVKNVGHKLVVVVEPAPNPA